MRRREPAVPIMVQDLLDGSREETPGPDGGTRNHVITPSGARVYRVVLSGVLMEREDIGSEGSPLLKLRLADPTGGISFTVGRYGQAQLEVISRMAIPSFATVVGKVSFFTTRKGEQVITINPELVVPCTREERDQWHRLCVRDAMLRLWKMSRDELPPIKGTETTAPEVPRGGEESLDEAISSLRKTLLSIDRPFFGKTLEDLKNGTLRPRLPEPESDLEEYEDQVVQMIVSLDKGDGARWDDIVDHIQKKKLSREIIEEVVSNLLDKGLLYEPMLGFLKAV